MLRQMAEVEELCSRLADTVKEAGRKRAAGA
jgi:hypothetical protein